MGECIMEYVIEYVIAGIGVSFVLSCLVGAWLIVRDKQAQWEADQDYKRMQESIKRAKKDAN